LDAAAAERRADRKAEEAARRKRVAEQERAERAEATIDRILNQEGQAKKQAESKKRKSERERDSAPRARALALAVQGPHIRMVSNATGTVVAIHADYTQVPHSPRTRPRGAAPCHSWALASFGESGLKDGRR